MIRRLGMATALLALALACRQMWVTADPYSGAETYRARCDDDRFWLYVAATRQGGVGAFDWAMELKIQSGTERSFTEGALLGGTRLPVERTHAEQTERVRPFSLNRSLFTEWYRMPLDQAAVEEVARTGLDAMLYGAGPPFRIRCEAELFREIQHQIGGGPPPPTGPRGNLP